MPTNQSHSIQTNEAEAYNIHRLEGVEEERKSLEHQSPEWGPHS